MGRCSSDKLTPNSFKATFPSLFWRNSSLFSINQFTTKPNTNEKRPDELLSEFRGLHNEAGSGSGPESTVRPVRQEDVLQTRQTSSCPNQTSRSGTEIRTKTKTSKHLSVCLFSPGLYFILFNHFETNKILGKLHLYIYI